MPTTALSRSSSVDKQNDRCRSFPRKRESSSNQNGGRVEHVVIWQRLDPRVRGDERRISSAREALKIGRRGRMSEQTAGQLVDRRTDGGSVLLARAAALLRGRNL